MTDQDPEMRPFFGALADSLDRWHGLTFQQRAERLRGVYSDLSEVADRETKEGDWVLLEGVDLSKLPRFLRVNTADLVEVSGYAPLPKQVLGGPEVSTLAPHPTFFIEDGFPGTDYISHFFVRNGKVGYVNGWTSGIGRFTEAPSVVKVSGLSYQEVKRPRLTY